MKTVKFTINWGGYWNVDDEYEIEVDDDATRIEIEEAVEEKYEELIHDNCSWEITEVEEDDD